MNAYYWFMLNLLLIIGAFFSTKYAGKALKPADSASEVSRVKIEKQSRKQPRPPQNKISPHPQSSSDSSFSSPAAMDSLWEATLFKPDRSESQKDGDKNSSDATNQARRDQAGSQFELVGLLRVKNDSLSPIAIIKQKIQNKRRYVNRGYRQRNLPVEPDKEKPLKRIFRIGDPINESGYVLTNINLLDNSLTLTRGTETLELKIQLGDKSSNERKQQATVQENILRKKRENIAATSKATAKDKKQGLPPPPPQRAGQQTPKPINPQTMTPQQIRDIIIQRQKLLLQKHRRK